MADTKALAKPLYRSLPLGARFRLGLLSGRGAIAKSRAILKSMGMKDRHVLEGHREVGPRHVHGYAHITQEFGGVRGGGGCDEKPGQAMAS